MNRFRLRGTWEEDPAPIPFPRQVPGRAAGDRPRSPADRVPETKLSDRTRELMESVDEQFEHPRNACRGTVKHRFDAGNTYQGIAGPIERVSVSSAGDQGNDDSVEAMISGDGAFVAFRSLASNLVAGDGNGRWDIFVHQRATGITTRVSVSSAGVEANHDSFSPSISDDGRFVAFRSNASNLVAGDGNARQDIFVHDRMSGTTVRVSMPDGGGEADGHSDLPAISGDGQWIVFESDATNLVPADTNRSRDIFRVANPLNGGTR